MRAKQRGGWSFLGTLLHQLRQQPAPFLPEEVGPRQTAISTDHAQVGDALLHQVVGGLQASLVAAELLTAGAADNGPTLMTRSGGISSALILFDPCTWCVMVLGATHTHRLLGCSGMTIKQPYLLAT